MQYATETTWVLYDAGCGLCTQSATTWGRFLLRHGIRMAPLQENWVQERLGLATGEVPDEMKVITPEGNVVGGINGVLMIASRVWWLRPIAILARLPGAHALLDCLYRWLARHRYALGGHCELPRPE